MEQVVENRTTSALHSFKIESDALAALNTLYLYPFDAVFVDGQSMLRHNRRKGEKEKCEMQFEKNANTHLAKWV